MSRWGALFVFFLGTAFLAIGLDWPKFIFVLSIFAVGVFEVVAIHEFNKMSERVDKLERELPKRKDGADNDR